MPKVDALFAEYASYHRDRRNELCHYVGITLIVLAVAALLSGVTLFEVRGVAVDLAVPVMLAVVVFYFALDVPLAAGAALVFTGLWLAGRPIPALGGAALFVVGWIFQFVGHAFEGKQPAFLRNGVHLLVGPLWILSHLYEKVGLRKKAEAAPVTSASP